MPVKHSKACNHVVFLKRCLSEMNTAAANSIRSQSEKLLVKERIDFWQKERGILSTKLRTMEEFLFSNLEHAEADHNWWIIMERKECIFQQTKEKQTKKFLNLKAERSRSVLPNSTDSVAWKNVINLSSLF